MDLNYANCAGHKPPDFAEIVPLTVEEMVPNSEELNNPCNCRRLDNARQP
jgi:hypothetical protein